MATTTFQIFTSQPVNFSAGAELPTRLKVLSWGDNPNTKGKPLKVGQRTLEVLPALQKARGLDKVALDFEHNTVPGSKAHQALGGKDPIPTAAFGAVEVVPGDGVYLNVERYTADGLAHASSYQDLSPAVDQDEHGEVLCVRSVALTRTGSIFGLEAFSADFDQDEAAAGNGAPDPDPEEAGTSELAKLQELVAAQQEQLKALAGKFDALMAQQPAKTPESFSTELAGLKSEIATFTAEARARDEKIEREQIEQKRIFEGRLELFTAEEAAKMPVDSLRLAYSRAPRVVSLSRTTPAAVPQTFSADPAAEAAKAQAISQEAEVIRKANPGKTWASCWDEAKARVK